MEYSVEEIKNSIAYCGLVCKLCHLKDKCDGCKSVENCCGAHLSEQNYYKQSWIFDYVDIKVK